VSLILSREYFLRKFGHFTDLGGNGVLRDTMGSSLGVSILTPKITCLTSLTKEAQKRESGGIDSEVISGGVSGWFWGGSWDSGIPCFHLNSRVSYFSTKCHLSV